MGIVLIKGLRRYAVVYVTRPTLILLDDAASQPLQRTNYVLVHLSKARSCPAERPVFCMLSFGLGLCASQLWQFVVGVGPGTGSGFQLQRQGVEKNRFELFGEGLVAWGQ